MKIYNEIVIDMNPESSSYGETLHEDSFDYEGPMALAGDVDADTQRDYMTDAQMRAAVAASGKGGTVANYTRGVGYWSVPDKEGNAYWLIKVNTSASDETIGDDGYWVMVTHQGHNYVADTYGTIHNRAGTDPGGILSDWYFSGGWDQPEGTASEEAEGVDPAKDIKYSDFAGYIDQETGTITDEIGLMNYLRTLPGADKLHPAEMKELLKTMPNLSVSVQDIREKELEYGQDIYGLEQDISGVHSQLGQERAKQASASGISGVMGPGSGIGGLDTSVTEGLYGNIADSIAELETTRAGKANYYGLGAEQEEELYNWLQQIQES